ncbi:nitronate monooxygenase, partial [Klebsiella pneumoniae]|nr:nitronate monooxygenase [Klebsiella pneumoniae]
HQSVELDPTVAQTWIDFVRPHFEQYDTEPPTQLHGIYPRFLDNDDFLNVVLETCPKAVSFHFGIPHLHQIQALKDAGILTMVSATNLAEAQ